MKILLFVISFVFVVSTIATLSKREEWWMRAFDFPFLQFSVFGFIGLVGWSFYFPSGWLEILISSLTLVCFIYRLAVIYPYTILKRPTIPKCDASCDTIRLVSGNVLMSNNNYEGCLKMVEKADPDILLLVEVDPKWEQVLSNQLKKRFSHQILHPLDNTYGMVLYSKFSLRNSSVEFLIEEDVPSFHTIIELPNGNKIRFYGLHPKPPAPGENDQSTPRDAELVMLGQRVRKSDLPVIVAGDMNDVAWSHTTRLFMRISGLLDPRMGRGFFNTFDATKPFLRWPLDHFFFSHHFKIVKLDRLENFDSDHFPILVDVALDPSIHAFKSKEHPDSDDVEEAQGKIDRV